MGVTFFVILFGCLCKLSSVGFGLFHRSGAMTLRSAEGLYTRLGSGF